MPTDLRELSGVELRLALAELEATPARSWAGKCRKDDRRAAIVKALLEKGAF
jgi:hypothetical protein